MLFVGFLVLLRTQGASGGGVCHVTGPPSQMVEDGVPSRLVQLSACEVYCLHKKCIAVPAPGASVFSIMVAQNFSLIFVGLDHGNGAHHLKLTSTDSARYIILQGRFFKTITPVLGKMKYILSNSWWDYKLTRGSTEEVGKEFIYSIWCQNKTSGSR